MTHVTDKHVSENIQSTHRSSPRVSKATQTHRQPRHVQIKRFFPPPTCVRRMNLFLLGALWDIDLAEHWAVSNVDVSCIMPTMRIKSIHTVAMVKSARRFRLWIRGM